MNLAVDGVAFASVQSNGWSNAQGLEGFGCRIPANYTVSHFNGSSLQGGWRARWYHQGYCENRALNEALYVNGMVTSTDLRFHFIYQSDGNLVLYRQNWTPMWARGDDCGDVQELSGEPAAPHSARFRRDVAGRVAVRDVPAAERRRAEPVPLHRGRAGPDAANDLAG